MPSRKWFAAQFTTFVGLGLMLVTGDLAVTDPEKAPDGERGMTTVELLLILILAVLLIALVVGWNVGH